MKNKILKMKNFPTILGLAFAVIVVAIMFGMFLKTTEETFYLKEVKMEHTYNTNVKYFLVSYEDKMYQVSKQDYERFRRHTGVKIFAIRRGYESKWEVMIEEEYYATHKKSTVMVWTEYSPTKNYSYD